MNSSLGKDPLKTFYYLSSVSHSSYGSNTFQVVKQSFEGFIVGKTSPKLELPVIKPYLF